MPSQKQILNNVQTPPDLYAPTEKLLVLEEMQSDDTTADDDGAGAEGAGLAGICLNLSTYTTAEDNLF